MEYPNNPPSPLNPQNEIDEGEYDLAPSTRPPETVAPSTDPHPIETDESDSVPTARVLSYQSPAGVGSNSAPVELDTEKLTKQTLPVCILTGGLLVEGFVATLRARSNPATAMIHLLVGVGISTLLMTAGVLIAARVRQIQIGSYGSAMLRLAAVIVGVAAVADILTPLANFLPFGSLGLLLVDFILYFALLGAFFDLDESDTWYCLCIIFLVHLVVYFASMVIVK